MSDVCLDCGACCHAFRVSFYWAETDEHPQGTVPAGLTTPISPYHVCMKGTDSKLPRCVALEGRVGEQVSCSIYSLRSSTCREFEAGTESCNQARANFGLPAISF